MKAKVPSVREDRAPAWVDLTDGIRVRKMVEAKGSTIMLYRLEAGRRFDSHQHSFPELGVVLAGEGLLLVGDEERRLREGDSYYIPADTEHGFEVLSDGPAVLMDVTAPLPPDILGPSWSEVLRIARAAARPASPG